MKDYIKNEWTWLLPIVMAFGGFLIAMFGIILNKDMLVRQQIFACIGFAMIAFSFPLDIMLMEYEDRKKKRS